MGNVGVHSDGSVRLLIHHFSRAWEGRLRCDLWNSDLPLRTDNGLLASAEGITAFRSCARSSKPVSPDGRRLTMSSSRWPRALVRALGHGDFLWSAVASAARHRFGFTDQCLSSFI